MIDLQDTIQIVADTFFGGDVQTAGLVLFVGVMLIVVAITRKAFISLLVALPVTFVFNQMNVISQDMMVLMIIVVVLGLAYTSRNVWRD